MGEEVHHLHEGLVCLLLELGDLGMEGRLGVVFGACGGVAELFLGFGEGGGGGWRRTGLA